MYSLFSTVDFTVASSIKLPFINSTFGNPSMYSPFPEDKLSNTVTRAPIVDNCLVTSDPINRSHLLPAPLYLLAHLCCLTSNLSLKPVRIKKVTFIIKNGVLINRQIILLGNCQLENAETLPVLSLAR